MRIKFCLYLKLLIIGLLTAVLSSPCFGQTSDPNPDSPTPILISESGSSRALTASASSVAAVAARAPVKVRSPAFPMSQRVVFYLTNINLMAGEDYTAFRLNVEDFAGRHYRFPVVNLQPLRDRAGVYALTVELRDELELYDQPLADGDVLISAAWRGLESNRLRFGLGTTGGKLRDPETLKTSPMPTAGKKLVQPAKSETPDAPDYIGYRYSGDRTRFMEQATFGPTAALDERIRRLGLRVWLESQFNEPYPTIPYPELPLMPSTAPPECNGLENPNTFPADPSDVYPGCRRDRYTMYPAQNWFFKEAFYGDAQLRHRVAWALSQLWVVSGNKITQASHVVAYHKVLSRNAFGNYRTLMQEMTLNPAMGMYLDMVRNSKNDLNENYAREVLQLFTIGLIRLNQNGTPQLDAEDKPIPTYEQDEVNNFTRVFTGWKFCETNGASCPNKTFGAVNYKDPLLLDQDDHTLHGKTLLDYPNAVNKNIPANLNGNAELNMALDNIYNHPNVAPFVSRILIQHLITSDPTPAYVGRISAVFNANRTSPTQLKEVVKAILLDPEARGNQKTDANYGKLREPVQLATNLLRQFKVQSADGAAQSDGYIANIVASMAQNVFISSTVFNYYPPNYIVPGAGLNGPEFGTLTTGTAIIRTNFINTVIFNRVDVGANSPNGTSVNLSEMETLAAADDSGDALLDALDTKLLHGTMTEQNRNSIKTALAAIPLSAARRRAQTAVYLIAVSSKYQVQR